MPSPTYFELCCELYRRGNYDQQVKTPWGDHEKQRLALKYLNDKTTSQAGYGGSGRSGKSWVASEWLTMQCGSYNGVGYGLGRRELKNLKRTTLRTLFKVFYKYRLIHGVDYKYNQQDGIISFPKTGSEIFLIETAYQPLDPLYMRFGGYELTGVVIDESAETDYKAIEILFGRCGFRKNIDYNLPPKMLEMFNPDKGHVYSRYYEPYKHNREKPNRKFIPALPKDNPDPAVKIWIEEQIANSSEITIQRLVNGDFDYDESKDRLIEHDALNNLFLNEHIKPTGSKYITADIARMGADATIILVWDGFVVTHRYVLNKSDISHTAKYIRDLATTHGVPMSHTIVDEDGVGGGCKDLLKCYGFVANKTPIGKNNYGNLKAQTAFAMARLINENKIYYSIKTPEIIQKIKQEADWVKQKDIDKDGKLYMVPKDIVKANIGRSPDDMDAICMRAYFTLGQKVG
jgi:phage terminase large subunit